MRRKGERVITKIKIKEINSDEKFYLVEIVFSNWVWAYRAETLDDALNSLEPDLRAFIGVKKKNIFDKIKTFIIARGSTRDD